MRVLVCGGRDFDDKVAMDSWLDLIHAKTPITAIINGGARGADSLASVWARSRHVDLHVYMADWERYNKSAGPIRNGIMITEGKPDLVVAFPGGKGTANMIEQAKAANIEVREIK